MARVAWLTGRRAARQWWSTRTVVALPLLLLAIPGSAWGLSDPKTTLPADIPLDTPMQMLFVSSLFILLTATLAAVLYAWDGVSRDRASGVLEVHLGRGMGRRGRGSRPDDAVVAPQKRSAHAARDGDVNAQVLPRERIVAAVDATGDLPRAARQPRGRLLRGGELCKVGAHGGG